MASDANQITLTVELSESKPFAGEVMEMDGEVVSTTKTRLLTMALSALSMARMSTVCEPSASPGRRGAVAVVSATIVAVDAVLEALHAGGEVGGVPGDVDRRGAEVRALRWARSVSTGGTVSTTVKFRKS